MMLEEVEHEMLLVPLLFVDLAIGYTVANEREEIQSSFDASFINSCFRA
jgi:hypothetical protein